MTRRGRSRGSGRPTRLRELLLAVPVLGLLGVLSAELTSLSTVVTVASLAISGGSIGLYLYVERTWPRIGGGLTEKD